MTKTNTAPEKPGHLVAKQDRRRIGCQEGFCNRWAWACEHVHWNTGNTVGVSFFYFCRQHTSRELAAILKVSR